MRIIIIEDEAPALSRIKKMVLELSPDIEVIGTADSIVSAVNLFQVNKNIELALMDIELADGQSFEIFKQVQVDCPVIFTTAYDEFALKAFKLNSIDYLLKPIDKIELYAALDKFKSLQSKSSNHSLNIEGLLEKIKPLHADFKSRFLLKNGSKLISVPVENIMYFHASDKLVFVYTRDKNKFVIDYSLDELSKMLQPNKFFLLNRQFIANLDAIQNIHTYFNGKLKVELIPAINEEIIVSREKAPEFKAWLDR